MRWLFCLIAMSLFGMACSKGLQIGGADAGRDNGPVDCVDPPPESCGYDCQNGRWVRIPRRALNQSTIRIGPRRIGHQGPPLMHRHIVVTPDDTTPGEILLGPARSADVRGARLHVMTCRRLRSPKKTGWFKHSQALPGETGSGWSEAPE
jgi:hypothetical protein